MSDYNRKEASRKGRETYKRNKELREARRIEEEAARKRLEDEAAKQIEALKSVRDHPDSTPAQRLEAVTLIAEYERRGFPLAR